jgi:hypothetical protein
MRMLRTTAMVMVCAAAGLTLAAESAQAARGPKPKIYEVFTCNEPSECLEWELEVFPHTVRLWNDALELNGTVHTYKEGHRKYTAFIFGEPGQPYPGLLELVRGVKDSKGYSSAASPGTMVGAYYRPENVYVEYSGTWWAVKGVSRVFTPRQKHA